MRLKKFLLIISFITCARQVPLASALIDDVLDVLHITKEVAEGVLKAWNFVQQTSAIGDGIDLPIVREKQKKVLRQMKELSRKIDQSESKYVNNMESVIQHINSFIKANTRLELQLHEMDDVMKRITTRHNQMQRYEMNQDKLEQTTLLQFAEWTVSPNAYAVNNLLEKLHLFFVGNDAETRMPAKSVLRMVADMLEYINTLEGTISFIHTFIEDNTRFELRMHEISDIINMIAIRHKQMQRYEAIQDKLEPITLMTYAAWTVSPNAHSVHFLLEQLNLIFVGDEDKESPISSKGVLQMFADMMEVGL